MSVKDLSAYELVKEEDLKGIKSHGMLLKHKKSGARILLIENDDDNKVFNIGFRTPPSDSTGVQHIMEHSGEGSVRRTGKGFTEYIFKCNDLSG